MGTDQRFSIPGTPKARTCTSARCRSGLVAQRLAAVAAAWCRDHLSFTPLGRSNSQGRALGGARTSFQVSREVYSRTALIFLNFFACIFDPFSSSISARSDIDPKIPYARLCRQDLLSMTQHDKIRPRYLYIPAIPSTSHPSGGEIPRAYAPASDGFAR